MTDDTKNKLGTTRNIGTPYQDEDGRWCVSITTTNVSKTTLKCDTKEAAIRAADLWAQG